MKIAVTGTGSVSLSNAMLLAQHHEVIAIKITRGRDLSFSNEAGIR